jgi:spectinomycin phosphotransferase
MTTKKPDLQDAKIADFLYDQYGLHVVEVAFLPIGYVDTAVYRVVAEDTAPYFVKFKRDVFDETSVTVPMLLRDRGVQHIIAPVATRSRHLWAQLDDFHVILYPFVEGHNAFKVALTERQWFDFGAALKGIHTTMVPQALSSRMQRETYSPQWREMLKLLQERVRKDAFDDPIAAQLAEFMTVKAKEIRHLVRKADQLSLALQAQDPEFVLCHSDIHAGNLLINANDRLYIVDSDNPILAPKERDLMFVGGGVGGVWYSAQEEALFYKGYGEAQINPIALAYYRFERIVQDIAPRAQQLLLTNAGGEERARTLEGIVRWFLSNEVVQMAYKAEKTLPLELRSP